MTARIPVATRHALTGVLLLATATYAWPASLTAGHPRIDSEARLPSHSSLLHDVLNRWQPIARAAGAESAAWRDVFATQLALMDSTLLERLAALQPKGEPSTSYARFLQMFRGAQMEHFESSRLLEDGRKLGSVTTDQVYVPIPPCRIVDTRNAGGAIAANTTRNFYFYAANGGNDWAGQGGVAGPVSTTCPGTLLPNGATYAPSAAVVTVTVVAPSAAGNWVIWGGANPRPTISALNWNAGDIAANTTIISEGQRAGNGPGGPVLDFAVSYNGPSGTAHFVADVVGYFVENAATALDCYRDTDSAVLGSQPVRVSAPVCNAGYALTGGGCHVGNPDFDVFLASEYQQGPFPQASWSCGFWGDSGFGVHATSICCRVPGR